MLVLLYEILYLLLSLISPLLVFNFGNKVYYTLNDTFCFLLSAAYIVASIKLYLNLDFIALISLFLLTVYIYVIDNCGIKTKHIKVPNCTVTDEGGNLNHDVLKNIILSSS